MRVLAEKSVKNGEVTLREAVGTLIVDFFLFLQECLHSGGLKSVVSRALYTHCAHL